MELKTVSIDQLKPYKNNPRINDKAVEPVKKSIEQCTYIAPIVPWSREGLSAEEIKRIEDFSNPAKNPFDRDPRTEAQKKAYDDNQAARRKMLAAFKEFENMRLAIPGKVPKTLQTFLKHKLANDDKYKAWVAAYREFKHG